MNSRATENNLATVTCFANPCPGCSNCDPLRPVPTNPRAAAYQRICRIAAIKGWDERTTRIMIADTFDHDVDRRPKPRRAVSPSEIERLTEKQMSKVAALLEEAFA